MAFGRRITVAVDAAGEVTTSTEAVGGLKAITDPITTLIDPDVALTGPAKYVQLGLAAVAGNMIAVKALSDSYGVALTRTMTFKFGG